MNQPITKLHLDNLKEFKLDPNNLSETKKTLQLATNVPGYSSEKDLKRENFQFKKSTSTAFDGMILLDDRLQRSIRSVYYGGYTRLENYSLTRLLLSKNRDFYILLYHRASN